MRFSEGLRGKSSLHGGLMRMAPITVGFRAQLSRPACQRRRFALGSGRFFVGPPPSRLPFLQHGPKPQHPEHQDRPLRHAGTARLRAGLAFRARPVWDHLFKDGKGGSGRAK
jgi:hypothetical protein